MDYSFSQLYGPLEPHLTPILVKFLINPSKK